MTETTLDRLAVELHSVEGTISVGFQSRRSLVHVQVSTAGCTPADRLRIRRIVRAHVRQPVVVEVLTVSAIGTATSR